MGKVRLDERKTTGCFARRATRRSGCKRAAARISLRAALMQHKITPKDREFEEWRLKVLHRPTQFKSLAHS